MNSGTFHLTSQEWYYSSREKMVGHTVHLAQLPDDRAGQGIFIDSTPPTGTDGNNFSNVPPFDVPDFSPYRTATYLGTTGYLVSPWEGASIFGGQTINPGLGWKAYLLDNGANIRDDAFFFTLSGTNLPQQDPGGMVVLIYGHPAGSPFEFGVSPLPSPDSSTNYAFVCDQEPFVGPLPVPPNGGVGNWPPPNLLSISRGDMGWYQNGPNWGPALNAVTMLGECFETQDQWLLVDNISFPHENLQGKAVGNASDFGVLPGTWRTTNYNAAFRAGPMNLLNGPNW